MNIIPITIVFLGLVNLFRMTLFIVGSDIYSYRAKNRSKSRLKTYPKISIIVPAHNEEKTILRAVQSLIRNKYPRHKCEVIVVDDGSTDNTFQIVKNYKSSYDVKNLRIVYQEQGGKALALNNAIQNYAKGELIMCLDSDSYLERDGLKKMAYNFRDKNVVAVAANVKIIPNGTLLNLTQKFEYIICYQMKKAQTVFNIEYIIGGIGSTFRKSTLKKVGYYDGNTVTEDIDLTMKILQLGNANIRAIYAADVIAYTEGVMNIGGLLKQRFRWKWGRSQTFLKNLNMFFSRDKKFTKGLTFFYLPFAIFGDLAFIVEPLLVTYIFYLIIFYGSVFTLVSAVAVISLYISLNIFLEDSIDRSSKWKMVLLSPLMYFLFYILSLVEYFALVKTLIKLPSLGQSIKENSYSWTHVDRLG